MPTALAQLAAPPLTRRTEFVTSFRPSPAATGRACSPQLPAGVPFVLFPALADWPKPKGFADIRALARHIHRARGVQSLTLTDDSGVFFDSEVPAGRLRRLVRVETFNEYGSTELIGFAWLNGGGRDMRHLQAALNAELAQ
jgi:hypothetical protein